MLPFVKSFEASERQFHASRDRLKFGLSRPGRAILWSLGAGAAGLFFYRMATFTPQPLDSSNTLRPFLNRWFIAFLKLYAQPEEALQGWESLCLMVLLIPPVLALLNFVREHRTVSLPAQAMRVLCSRNLWFVSIAIALTACRYSSFLTYQLNPDEAEFLSAAQKLFWDGNFFRSVDTGTSGPLNIYPLMLPALFGLSPDFASSRVLVLIFTFCDIYLLYRTIRLLAHDSVARIAIVPFVTAFAVFRDPNFLHYSSEQTPLLLISAALYTSVSVLANPSAPTMRLLLLGFLASASFFSKMQSVPVIVAMAAVAIAYTHASGHARRFWRPSALFVAGALPLLLLNAALCWPGGVWRDFWMSYIISNQRYADVQSNFLRDLSKFVQFLIDTSEVRLFLLAFVALGVAFVLQRMRSDRDSEQSAFLRLCFAAAIVMAAGDRLQSSDASTLRGCLALFGIVTAPLYFLFRYRPRSFGADPVRWFGLLSTLSIAAALYSVYTPHRPFLHYLVFLYVPVFAAMAWMLTRQVGIETPQRLKTTSEDSPGSSLGVPFGFVFLFVVLAVVNAAYVWGCQADQDFDAVIATVKPPEGDFIRSMTSPDGQITVWGWTADPYLGSGRVAATRDLNIAYLFFMPPEVTSYYRGRWLHDIAENPPELFIDATGATSFWVVGDRTAYRFEQFPELAKFVENFYVHLVDGFGQRYYLRRDLAANQRSIPMPKSCAPEALRCVDTPLRAGGAHAEVRDVTTALPNIELPAHVLIEAQFTPAAVQTANATVFNNEAVPYSRSGFRFQTIGDDRYQLVLGLGLDYASSKPIFLPPGKPAIISIEMNDRNVYIRANGSGVEEMHLPRRMAGAPGPITLGSFIGGQRRFWGTIQFFQIVDLDKKTDRS